MHFIYSSTNHRLCTIISAYPAHTLLEIVQDLEYFTTHP